MKPQPRPHREPLTAPNYQNSDTYTQYILTVAWFATSLPQQRALSGQMRNVVRAHQNGNINAEIEGVRKKKDQSSILQKGCSIMWESCWTEVLCQPERKGMGPEALFQVSSLV